MGKIKFEGNPPYALPIVQDVTARAEGAAVVDVHGAPTGPRAHVRSARAAPFRDHLLPALRQGRCPYCRQVGNTAHPAGKLGAAVCEITGASLPRHL